MDEVALRPVGPGDDELLFRVYAATRAEELAVVPWDDSVKGEFLRQQFDVQRAAYEGYAGSSRQVVLVGGEPAGRLYVARSDAEIVIIDIALLPEYRGRGIGTALVRGVLDEATAGGKVVRMHVERHNPALRLYERLGFSIAEDRGVYLFLEAAPQVKTAS
ncbi:MAG: GNAT family N-acetyltransferase [Actinomycetota bacterium]|nr:GNAT family N-acetyltransferase [Actinomycetota bacterium]